LRIGGSPGGGDLPLGLVRHARVAEAVLHQESAPDALVIEGLIVAELRKLHDPQILLLLEQRDGLGIDARCDDDLHKQVAHRLGRRAIDDGVERDDRTECRRAVGRERAPIRVGGVPAQRDAAGRRVLDDDASGARVLILPRRHRHDRGVDIQQVVERQLLAVQLMHVADAGFVRHVQRGALVRILAVAQRLLPLHHDAQRRRQRLL